MEAGAAGGVLGVVLAARRQDVMSMMFLIKMSEDTARGSGTNSVGNLRHFAQRWKRTATFASSLVCRPFWATGGVVIGS